MRTLFISLVLWAMTVGISLAQGCGCTDPMATNYDSAATVNDGSCLYASASIRTKRVGLLDSVIEHSSSLIYWNNGYWSYNDHNDCCLYKIDTTSGVSPESLCVKHIRNKDTEEIAQDSTYLYFGDFGNNSGNRKDLHILRISKQSLLNQTFAVDTIWFSYEDQTDFTRHLLATDYDCEAFIVTNDSLYLFTKQWISAKTTLYALPKTPGKHVAQHRETYDVKGLITGATYIPEYQLIVLCGYDYNPNHLLSALQPFLVLLYDFKEGAFFSGNKRRLGVSSPARAQIEGIATSNALDYYLTCEHFQKTVMGFNIEIPAQLMRIDLRKYLPYIAKRKS